MRIHASAIPTQAIAISKAVSAATNLSACGGRSLEALSTNINLHAALDTDIQADDEDISQDLRREAHERRYESTIALALADTLLRRVEAFQAEFINQTPAEDYQDPLSQAVRKAIANKENLAISMRNIAATTASDENSHVEALQDRRASDASKIDGMALYGAEHATQSQAPVDFPLPLSHQPLQKRR